MSNIIRFPPRLRLVSNNDYRKSLELDPENFDEEDKIYDTKDDYIYENIMDKIIVETINIGSENGMPFSLVEIHDIKKALEPIIRNRISRLTLKE